MLVLAFLFTQVATAAYACPAVSAPSMAGMPCAQMMSAGAALDAEQPGLCQQHCQQGNTQQVGDSSMAPLPTPVLVALFTLSPVVPLAADGSLLAAHERRRDHAPPPAHSLLHCCYRI